MRWPWSLAAASPHGLDSAASGAVEHPSRSARLRSPACLAVLLLGPAAQATEEPGTVHDQPAVSAARDHRAAIRDGQVERQAAAIVVREGRLRDDLGSDR